MELVSTLRPTGLRSWMVERRSAELVFRGMEGGGGAGRRLVSLLLFSLLLLQEFGGTTDAASYDLLGHTELPDIV